MPERSMLEWVLIGLVLGVVLRLLTRGRDTGGFIVAILIGIVGAILGGAIARMMETRIGGGWVSDVAAAAGAIVLLAVYRLILARRTA
jgi:uncharacterized membrane protein YeaQ/YmgE (transglycosylase-associated protein family)